LNKEYKTLDVEFINQSVLIWLNRPHVHNAFNRDMIKELIHIISRIGDDKKIRSILISGRGKSFSAGADLNWMQESIGYSKQENMNDSALISEMFHKLYTSAKPVISAVNGAAIGGGMGFIAVSDIVMAAQSAVFGLSEVRIGLIPAVISTYLFRKSTSSRLRELFITGRRFNPETALEIGLINDVTDDDKLLEKAMEKVSEINSSGPDAVAACKKLFIEVPNMKISEAAEFTSELLATLRIGDEAQEGMRAFLEKRDPDWKDK